MKTTIKLTNANRGCCFNSTYKEIGELTGVFGVNIDTANNTITVDHTDEVTKEEIIKRLKEIGYTPVEEK